MNTLRKLERKFGKFAIQNLTLYIVVGIIAGYAIMLFFPNLSTYFTLDPHLVVRGQVWRLLSWLFVPPSGLSLFSFLVPLFYYYVGTNLERAWGKFIYNLFIFGGIIFTIFGAVFVYLFYLFVLRTEIEMSLTTYYLTMSMFLSFATCYPDEMVRLYFIIPIKMKYLALFDGALILIGFFTSPMGGKVIIVSSLLNFLIFFFATRDYKRVSPAHLKRKTAYKKQVRSSSIVTRHKCAICGKSEEDDPNLTFRYCSKCKGNYEYCQDHLFTHEHIK